MHRFGIYIVLLCLVGMSCEKQYPWDFKTEDLNRVVVDGIITNELKQQEIRLSLTNDGLNQAPEPLSGATVFIEVENSPARHEFFEEALTPGLYLSESFQAVIDHLYRLTVIVETDTFQAWAGTEPVTPLSDLVTVLDTNRNKHRYIFNEYGRSSMTKVFYNWTEDTAFCQEYGYCQAQETYYHIQDQDIDINQIFGTAPKTLWFPPGAILVREKYSLTEPHQEFIRSLLMETDWSGGIFDVQHGNVQTNLSNGAVGYFAACMVVRDTAFVE